MPVLDALMNEVIMVHPSESAFWIVVKVVCCYSQRQMVVGKMMGRKLILPAMKLVVGGHGQ
jgi:hypothetical protein